MLSGLSGLIDLVLDAGPTRWRKASTILAFDALGRYNILREGVYDQRILEQCMRRQILFVCTGNTCRSAMAEGLTRTLMAGSLGCAPDDLAAQGWVVGSAGMLDLAAPGRPGGRPGGQRIGRRHPDPTQPANKPRVD